MIEKYHSDLIVLFDVYIPRIVDLIDRLGKTNSLDLTRSYCQMLFFELRQTSLSLEEGG